MPNDFSIWKIVLSLCSQEMKDLACTFLRRGSTVNTVAMYREVYQRGNSLPRTTYPHHKALGEKEQPASYALSQCSGWVWGKRAVKIYSHSATSCRHRKWTILCCSEYPIWAYTHFGICGRVLEHIPHGYQGMAVPHRSRYHETWLKP